MSDRQVRERMPSGIGGRDPDFRPTGAQVGRGRTFQVQAMPTQFDRFRDILMGPGRAAISAVRGQQAAEQNMERLRSQVMARNESIVQAAEQANIAAGRHRAAQAAAQQKTEEQKRMDQARNRLMDILSSENSENPTWVMQETGKYMANAATTSERALWFNAWDQARQGTRREAEQLEAEARREELLDFAQAGNTAANIAQIAQSELQDNPQLQRELIGNGGGIHNRTQEWLLAEAAQASPEFFNISPDDPLRDDKLKVRDDLIQQIVKQSIRLGDSLVQQHVQESRTLRQQQAERRFESSSRGWLRGDLTFEDMVAIDETTEREMLGFKTQSERQTDRDRRALHLAQRLGDMEDGITEAEVMERLNEVTEAMPHLESRIGNAFQERFERNLTDSLLNRVDRILHEQQTSLGTAPVNVAVDAIREAAELAAMEIGIPDPDQRTLAHGRMQRMIDRVAGQLTQQESQRLQQVNTETQQWINSATGRTTNPDQAYKGSPLALSLAEGLEPQSPQMQVFQEHWSRENDDPMPWEPDSDGIFRLDVNNPDHVEMLSSMARMEADIRRSDRGVNYEISSNQVKDLTAWLQSGNAGLTEAALEFTVNLGPKGHQALMSKLDDNDRKRLREAERMYRRGAGLTEVVSAVANLSDDILDQSRRRVEEVFEENPQPRRFTETNQRLMSSLVNTLAEQGFSVEPTPLRHRIRENVGEVLPTRNRFAASARHAAEQLESAIAAHPREFNDAFTLMRTWMDREGISEQEAADRLTDMWAWEGIAPLSVGQDDDGNHIMRLLPYRSHMTKTAHLPEGVTEIGGIQEQAWRQYTQPFYGGQQPGEQPDREVQREMVTNLLSRIDGLTDENIRRFVENEWDSNEPMLQTIFKIVNDLPQVRGQLTPLIGASEAELRRHITIRPAVYDSALMSRYAGLEPQDGGGLPIDIFVGNVNLSTIFGPDDRNQLVTPFTTSFFFLTDDNRAAVSERHRRQVEEDQRQRRIENRRQKRQDSQRSRGMQGMRQTAQAHSLHHH